MKVLQQNSEYRVIIERLGMENWVELHERSTGMVWILKHDPRVNPDNKIASLRKVYGDELSIEQIKQVFDRLGIIPLKMYKEGV